MAAGCFDTANRRRTEYISLCANLAVRLFHIDLLHLLLKIASERKADPASDSTLSNWPQSTVLLTTAAICS